MMSILTQRILERYRVESLIEFHGQSQYNGRLHLTASLAVRPLPRKRCNALLWRSGSALYQKDFPRVVSRSQLVAIYLFARFILNLFDVYECFPRVQVKLTMRAALVE